MKCCPKNPKRKQQQAKAAGPWAAPSQSQSSRWGGAGVLSKAGRERFVSATLRNAQQSGWCEEPEWEDVCVSVLKTPVECFVGVVGDDGECIANSGCSLGLFTPAFEKFVVSSEDRSVDFRLTSDAAPLSLRGFKTVHLPFEDEGGNVRIVPEEGCINKLIGRTLLPCAKKKLHLKGEDSSDDDSDSSWVRLRNIHGRWFRAPINQTGSVPMLRLAQNKEAIAASCVCPPVSTFPLSESALSGQSDLSEENKAHLLHVLHSRLGHATGQRLEATLKEKGVGVPYSVGEC
uniref:Uncharacterized protein n=1 Tax=Chromera velia CCMP2878 TaxID=1169474 RepID=A0A0G4HQD7_9ALVE|eukprot:Cvel_7953.t1-p1 / transcript=Cvel_7953.t1 / gene=Cvel_7953 / organism=Chromera_velia_CCMP2878 / gene_product=hypothetical protein / transcript_product=hypothetical protein / location=Cvel_scaffold427:89057-90006(-) / protein_length=288 / sequence_SO=supercontig / SO=protein_coding / is_pseudo=false